MHGFPFALRTCVTPCPHRNGFDYLHSPSPSPQAASEELVLPFNISAGKNVCIRETQAVKCQNKEEG